MAVNQVPLLATCLEVERTVLCPDREGGDDKISFRIPSLRTM